jgi:lipid-binding SYLF domain-containing protein
MFSMTKIAFAAVIAMVVFLSPAARAASEQENMVDEARITVDNLKKDQEFGNAVALMRKARGVLIVPALLKGGFFVGGEGGSGVLLTRNGGTWSYPAFYTLASGSFGLQIGLEQAELIMIVMNEKALSAIMRSEFKVGADAGIAIVTLGSSAEAATTRAAGADIVVWASASGAYAGISVNGSIIRPRASWNDAYYGHAVRVSDIVLKRAVKNPNADVLRQDLASVR